MSLLAISFKTSFSCEHPTLLGISWTPSRFVVIVPSASKTFTQHLPLAIHSASFLIFTSKWIKHASGTLNAFSYLCWYNFLTFLALSKNYRNRNVSCFNISWHCCIHGMLYITQQVDHRSNDLILLFLLGGPFPQMLFEEDDSDLSSEESDVSLIVHWFNSLSYNGIDEPCCLCRKISQNPCFLFSLVVVPIWLHMIFWCWRSSFYSLIPEFFSMSTGFC